MNEEDIIFKTIQLTTDYGYEEFYVCRKCSAVVEYQTDHIKWHQAIIAALDKKKDCI